MPQSLGDGTLAAALSRVWHQGRVGTYERHLQPGLLARRRQDVVAVDSYSALS